MVFVGVRVAGSGVKSCVVQKCNTTDTRIETEFYTLGNGKDYFQELYSYTISWPELRESTFCPLIPKTSQSLHQKRSKPSTSNPKPWIPTHGSQSHCRRSWTPRKPQPLNLRLLAVLPRLGRFLQPGLNHWTWCWRIQPLEEFNTNWEITQILKPKPQTLKCRPQNLNPKAWFCTWSQENWRWCPDNVGEKRRNCEPQNALNSKLQLLCPKPHTFAFWVLSDEERVLNAGEFGV